MKKGLFVILFTFSVTYLGLLLAGNGAIASEPIVIGVATSLRVSPGDHCLNAATIAVDEINSKGGVTVGSSKRPFKIVTADLRDAEPGVPVTEALLGIEKLILGQKVNALLVGPFRSEALLASMDIIGKYKVPMLSCIAMTPEMENKLQKDYEKYKYTFRLCLTSKYLIQYLSGIMAFLQKEFGFSKVYIFHQDVAWCRATIKLMTDLFFNKAGWTIVGQKAYPTGTSDFSSGLMEAQAKGAQVIMPVFDMPQAGILVKQWKSMKVPALIAGYTGNLGLAAHWNAYGGTIGGAIDLVMEAGSGIGVKKIPQSLVFHNKYIKRWGDYPEGPGGHGIAPTYESVYVLAEAIERAGNLEPETLVKELEKTDKMGVMGRIKFEKNHQVPYGINPEKESVGVGLQWSDKGERVVIYPESIAEGNIKLPLGLKSAK